MLWWKKKKEPVAMPKKPKTKKVFVLRIRTKLAGVDGKPLTLRLEGTEDDEEMLSFFNTGIACLRSAENADMLTFTNGVESLSVRKNDIDIVSVTLED